MNGQAKKGGERGINGEWYDGGQFLPSSEKTIKGAKVPIIRKGKKAEIEPYKWEASPADDMLSIYEAINHFCQDNRDECQYQKGVGFIGYKITAPHDTDLSNNPIDATRREWLVALIERFNNGERWMPLKDHKYHYKNQA